MILPGCLCLFLSVLEAPTGRLQKPVMYLGKISYGLYMYHVLWLGVSRQLVARMTMGRCAGELMAMGIALPATIVTAMLSYRYLESPFLRWKERFTVMLSRPV